MVLIHEKWPMRKTIPNMKKRIKEVMGSIFSMVSRTGTRATQAKILKPLREKARISNRDDNKASKTLIITKEAPKRTAHHIVINMMG